MDSTKQIRHHAVARAHYDVFQVGLPWKGMAKLYKGSIFVITETQFAFQSENMAALLNSLFFLFNISFLPKYRVKYYYYIVKW